MATQRYDIEIRDTVARSIRSEITAIGAAAKSTYSEIQKMKSALASTAQAQAQASTATSSAATAAAKRKTTSDASAAAMRKEKEAADALTRSYQAQAAAARSQTNVNNLLGVNRGTGRSAKDSASVFQQAGLMGGADKAASETDKLTQSISRMNKEAPLARQHLMNLGFQVNDVVVSLMSGQKPLTVFVQQGAQIGQIAAQAGVGIGGMTRAVIGLLVPFAPFIAALGAGVAAWALFDRSITKGIDTSTIVNGLGLTRKEIKKLENTTITSTDVMKATFQVAFEEITKAWGINVKDWQKIFSDGMDNITNKGRVALAALVASFSGTRAYLAEIEKGGIGGLVTGKSFEGLVEKTYGKEYDEYYKYLGEIGDKIRKRVVDNKKTELQAQADEIKSNRGPGRKGPKGFDRAKELNDENNALDAQIRLLGFYGDELERQTQLEQIAQKFREKGVPLTLAESEALMKKITTIQEGTRIQAAMTRADQEANGALREYNDTVEALNRLLEKGAISQAEFMRQQRLAERAFEDATNPLARFNRELERNWMIVGRYGKDRTMAEYIKSLEDAAQAQGKTIFEGGGSSTNADGSIGVTGSKRLNSEAQGLVSTWEEQQKQDEMAQAFERIDPRENQDVGGSSYILDNAKTMYEELDRLRQQDVINEEEAAERKKNLDRAVMDAKLEYTSSMFGQLATLQTSKNRELAAIGKAAAIAQATIDGYRAVQAALVGPPGPPWSYAIAATTAAMTATNIAKIAGVGFMSGGYTGNMPSNSVAGQVHGQEYVFDAAATKRLGVANLDALRRGSLSGVPANDNGAGRGGIKITQGPGTYVEAVERSDGEIEIIAERVARRVAPGAVAADISGNPNSRTSKALTKAYGMRRNDR